MLARFVRRSYCELPAEFVVVRRGKSSSKLFSTLMMTEEDDDARLHVVCMHEIFVSAGAGGSK